MAHHRDDVIETLIINMLFSREISTQNPCQEIFGKKFYIIRPFYLVPEKLLIAFNKEKQWITSKPLCKQDGLSKRQYIKDVIDKWQSDHPSIDVKANLFASLKAVKQSFLPFETI